MSELKKRVFQKRILFVGIPDMAYVCLDGLKTSGVNIVGVMGAKKNHPTYNNFKQFVASRNLNFIEYDDLKDEKFIQAIKDLNIDVALVCSFNYKVPKVLRDAVKDGFINVHPALLPNYRGKNPYSSVIVNKEEFTGVTLHFMDEGFDTGDIIAQHKIAIHPKETMGTLFNRLNFLGFELLLKTLSEYEKSPLKSQKQPQGNFIEGFNFSEDELFLDYNKPAGELERFIRALNPFFIASTLFRQTMVKIYAAEVVEQTEISDCPMGTIVKIEKDRFYIKTPKGLLCPTIIQFGSFFVATAESFIESVNLKVGETFKGEKE